MSEKNRNLKNIPMVSFEQKVIDNFLHEYNLYNLAEDIVNNEATQTSYQEIRGLQGIRYEKRFTALLDKDIEPLFKDYDAFNDCITDGFKTFLISKVLEITVNDPRLPKKSITEYIISSKDAIIQEFLAHSMFQMRSELETRLINRGYQPYAALGWL